MPNESARTAPGLRKWKSGRDTTCSLLHIGVEASGNLRIKRFVEKRGGRDREGSFDYFHPLKASPNIQSRTPLLSDHLLFQLSYTSFTFRRQGGVVDGKGEREEIGRERRSVTLQVPPRPRRSLSWATSIDNLLSLSLLPFLAGIIGIPRSGGNIALPERVLQVESWATSQATMTPSNVSCKSHRRDPTLLCLSAF